MILPPPVSPELSVKLEELPKHTLELVNPAIGFVWTIMFLVVESEHPKLSVMIISTA